MKKYFLIVALFVVATVSVVLFLFTALSDITADEARESVRELREVAAYEQTLGDAGSRATFGVEDNSGRWLVHVYEIVVRGDSSHTATFGWYSVDKKTGVVEKEI